MEPAITKSRQIAHSGAATPACVSVCLSNGRYSVHLNDLGSGFSETKGIAITRWSPDRTTNNNGYFIYLRDLDGGPAWSASYQPTRVENASASLTRQGSVASIVQEHSDIRSVLQIAVAETQPFEVRCCQLTNNSDRPRRIELTSYLEWVLGPADADANHPAFSKLFVETRFCAEQNAILAKRRKRQATSPEFTGFHSVIADRDDVLEDISFETNRARFLGRGRTLSSPAIFDSNRPLSGDAGPVLDPIASLRVTVRLEPGETREIAYILGASDSQSEVDAMLDAVSTMADVQALLDDAKINDANCKAVVANTSQSAIAVNGYDRILHPAHGHNAISSSAASFSRSAEAITQNSAHNKFSAAEKLDFQNGVGGFTADGREYVLLLEPDDHGRHKLPPMPWVNVIANERAGFLVTESGAGYTWSGNSRTNRLTAWQNDPVSDPHSEALFLRDEDRGVYWSLTPGPCGAPCQYKVRHGFGYTVFENESHELSQSVTVFMARTEPVKFVRIRLKNCNGRIRRLSVFSFLQWALGGLCSETAGKIETDFDPALNAICAKNPFREKYSQSVAFSALANDAAAQSCDVSYTADRESFLGPQQELNSPAALTRRMKLNGYVGADLDPCAAWKLDIELGPYDEFECTFLLGETADRESARLVIQNFSDSAAVENELSTVVNFWRELTSAVNIETPNREIDLMVNGWLAYQNLSCRMWGRSAYYQPGGAFGFRDQLQDSAALIYHDPQITRSQILLHAAQQFFEGDVLHWWHPDIGCGLRTRFSDDLLWLPLIAAEYVQKTGDTALWDEVVPYIDAAQIPAGEQEIYLCPTRSATSGTLYEHCCRALDRGLTAGSHGLPLIGCGDWNDGFSRVGAVGRGESVWLGFFIEFILQKMLPICAEYGDTDRVARYTAYRERLAEALQTAGWDGEWYRRAYFDDGEPLGTAEADECQIDALAQSWAVISNAAPPDRAQQAMTNVERHLVRDDEQMIHLLTPAFNRMLNDPGYIMGYLPGIRENGGQYTHGVLWVIRAFAEMGHGTRAAELLRMLSPVSHTSSPELVAKYQTEPYVVAADVYGEPPHRGRGGWTWYTGSAGWMFRVAVESVLGFSIENGTTLVLNPSISADWPSCRLTYHLPSETTEYDITINNPKGREHGLQSGSADGVPLRLKDGIARIPLTHDGRTHPIVVYL